VQRLHDLIAHPFPLDRIRLTLEARIGVAHIPGDGDFEILLRHAGIALTTAKADNRSLTIYNPDDDHHDLARLTIATELREAIRTDQLLVHYQPQADVATGWIRGAEALIRWQHPERGLLAATDFIPAAERSGQITEIGRFVLAASTRQWQRWNSQGIKLEIAVNLAPIDFLDVSLPGEITALLVEHKMPPEYLLLEITERTLLAGEQRVRKVLKELNRIGVRLAIDDYGTGYSSLATLRQLPIQQVKLDRCFVTGIPTDKQNDEIVRSTVHLAHALGVTVVAEGVETEPELQRLASHGCDIAQGYLIGRPEPPDQLTQFIERQRGGQATPPTRKRQVAPALAL
jgi:EAL domain-containing protein (putative c-di-GMP-specific phosphodiesterase class I)